MKVNCDRCGTEIEDGLDKCIKVVDLDKESGVVVHLHFCRENRCAARVLSKANTAARRDAGEPKTLTTG